MASRSTIHVIHVSIGEASDIAHWLLTAVRFIKPSTALSEEYFSEDCQVGFLYARFTKKESLKD